ncbi:MAG TPA: DUF998 domain-containing protein [Aequorivita sp.]|nr:DUF998 domain-containing protein [Aequorivita sp.]
MTSKTTALLGIVGGVLFIATAIASGFQMEDYSHISQFISEAYAFGTTYGIYFRLAGYIPAGILLFFFGMNAYRFFEKSDRVKLGFIGFAVFYGLGTIMVSLFPCDEGCNKEFIQPSISQIIHNLLSVATYVIVPACLILIGSGLKKTKALLGNTSMVLGTISGLFALLLFSDHMSKFIGLYQRIVEASILIWIFLIAGRLLKKRSTPEIY